MKNEFQVIAELIENDITKNLVLEFLNALDRLPSNCFAKSK